VKNQNFKFQSDVMKKNLVLLGMMGVGKTTFGKILANKYKYNFIDIDSNIEKKNLMSINEIFEKKGENFFRIEEEKITLNSLDEKNCIIALGGGAFINEKIREKVLNLSISIWLNADIDLISKRLKKNVKRPLLKNKNIKKKLNELYAKRKNIYNLANYKVDCDKLSIKEVVKKIMTIYEYDKR